MYNKYSYHLKCGNKILIYVFRVSLRISTDKLLNSWIYYEKFHRDMTNEDFDIF